MSGQVISALTVAAHRVQATAAKLTKLCAEQAGDEALRAAERDWDKARAEFGRALEEVTGLDIRTISEALVP